MNKINLSELGDYDCLEVKIMVKPGTKVNFEKGNLLCLTTSPITKEEFAMFSGKYLGKAKYISAEEVCNMLEDLKKALTNNSKCDCIITTDKNAGLVDVLVLSRLKKQIKDGTE